MDYIMTEFSSSITDLWRRFGWWAVLLVAATFGIMIGVNYLLKFLFRKAETTQMTALRKFLSTLSVFVVAIGVMYLFNIIVDNKGVYSFTYALNNAIPIASAAMMLWAIWKVIARVGLLPLFALLKNRYGKEFTAVYNAIPLDNSVKKIILKKIEDYIADRVPDDLDVNKYIDENDIIIYQKIQNLLEGFVDSGMLQDVSEQFLKAVKSKK